MMTSKGCAEVVVRKFQNLVIQTNTSQSDTKRIRTFLLVKKSYFSTTSSSLIFHLQPLMPSLMPRHQYRACTRPIQAPGEGIYISIDAPLSSSSPKIGNILKSMGWFGLNWSCHVCLNLVWSYPEIVSIKVSISSISEIHK